ncbi:MAG TPA: CCA tRNA nucleotidyltransferase [Anaeromyxobacter sp.]
MHRRRPHHDTLSAAPARDLEEPRDGPPPGLALDPPEEPPLSHPPEIEVERLDPDALKVIARLRHMRHKAYFVGGCVRDLLLGAKPKDFDVATDAHPGEVRAIFRNCRLIGRRFRLAHVYFRGGKVIEVATFRKNPTDVADDLPENGGDLLITRDNVFGTAEEDAVRRDFTVNGLFYDVGSGEVFDYVGGRADLEAHRIATIGEPEVRMREDPVRALRAVRFAARLGFTIAPDTFAAMRRHSGELARCAPARVLEEMFKILRCGGSARAFELLRACGALQVVLPALANALDVWDEGRRRGFLAHLGALDRMVRGGEEVSEAVLLGALLMHLPTGGRGEAAPPGPPLAPGQPQPAAPALARGSARGRGEAAPPGPPLVPGQPQPAAPALARGNARGRGRGEAARGDAEWSTSDAREADVLLTSLVQTSRLPRKIAERTRLALHAQRHLREPPRRRRRRGRGLAGQQYFTDSMQLLRITVEATGEGRDVLERWTAHREEPDAPAPEPEAAREEREGAGDGGSREEPAAPRAAPEAGTTAAPAAEGQPGGRRRRRRRGGRRRRRRGAGAPVAP